MKQGIFSSVFRRVFCTATLMGYAINTWAASSARTATTTSVSIRWNHPIISAATAWNGPYSLEYSARPQIALLDPSFQRTPESSHRLDHNSRQGNGKTQIMPVSDIVPLYSPPSIQLDTTNPSTSQNQTLKTLGSLEDSLAQIKSNSGISTHGASLRTIAQIGRVMDGSAHRQIGDANTVILPETIFGRNASGLSPPTDATRTYRPLQSIREFFIMTFNVFNLEQYRGKYHPDPDQEWKLRLQEDTRTAKPEWAIREAARAIRDINPDIAVLQEVENKEILERFVSQHLSDEEGRPLYDAYLIEGNDGRGIDIAFLIKRDLPLRIEHRTHKNETWVDPTTGVRELLFSRDLPSLVVRAFDSDKPLFILFGTHFKSKRMRHPRDPESTIKRTAQAEKAAEIIGRYRQEFGNDVPLMFAGDFNDKVKSDGPFARLFGEAGLADALDLSPTPVPPEERITHTYHPKDGPTQFQQLDAVLMSRSLRPSIRDARVYRYKDQNGRPKPIPRTWRERKKNPSDHFPVAVTLFFPNVLEAADYPPPNPS